MLLSHGGKKPRVDPSAFVAPTATVCGDVNIGPDCRIMHGASIVAEGGRIDIGKQSIIFENAVVRSNISHSTAIGNFCLIGPNAHVVGCTVEDEAFIATGAAIFHQAIVGKGCQVRINAVVHIKSYLKSGEIVPIGWIAVGNPAELFPPNAHDQIWEVQQPLNFPLTVYGFDRPDATMERITRKLSEILGSHKDDETL